MYRMCVRHARGQAAVIGGDSVARGKRSYGIVHWTLNLSNVDFTTIQYYQRLSNFKSFIWNIVLMVFGTIETSGYRRAPLAALFRFIEENKYLYVLSEFFIGTNIWDSCLRLYSIKLSLMRTLYIPNFSADSTNKC